MRSLLRRSWVRTFVAVFAVCLVIMVVVNAVGGYAHPVYFVGLGLAAAALVVGIQIGAERIDPWNWPESETAPPRFRRLGVDDRALNHQHRLARKSPQARATAVRPALADLVAERLHRSRGMHPDDLAAGAGEWVSSDLGGLLDGSRTTLTLDEFDELMKEIETL
ncbi:MAG: hypothetical protein ACTH2Q_06130 [Propionibacteriaceae bacterium]